MLYYRLIIIQIRALSMIISKPISNYTNICTTDKKGLYNG